MPATSKTEQTDKLPVDKSGPEKKGGPEKDTPVKKEFSAKQLLLGCCKKAESLSTTSCWERCCSKISPSSK